MWGVTSTHTGGTVDGEVAAGFDDVREAFAQVVAGQPGTGAAMAAWHDGRWVARLQGGWADGDRTVPWRPDSIVMPYSVSKPVGALPLLLLVDDGRVGLDAPVQTYWPEFRARATVRQVLSHTAGVVALDEPLPTEAFYDWDRLCAALARQEPSWTPGERGGESALFFGHLVGEIVRRVEGRSLGTVLRERVTGPLGADVVLGLGAADLGRAVELTGLDDPGFRARLTETGLRGRARTNPPGAFDAAVVNGERWRAAEVPAVNVPRHGGGLLQAVRGAARRSRCSPTGSAPSSRPRSGAAPTRSCGARRAGGWAWASTPTATAWAAPAGASAGSAP